MMKYCRAFKKLIYRFPIVLKTTITILVPEEGQAYPIFCRKYQSLDASEEILLDQNELAKDEDFFSLGAASVSPNQQILAYSTDTTGAEQYTLFFLDLNTKKLYSETIADTYYSLAWGMTIGLFSTLR